MAFAFQARLRPSTAAPFLLLSARPIVFHVRDYAFEPGAPIHRLLRALRDRRVDILYTTSWNHARRRRVERLVRLQRRIRRTGDHRITFLAASPDELEHVRASGLPTLHVNNAAFLDERIFRPLPDRQIRFDAVYDARFSRFKRHALAAEIPNLALITYSFHKKPEPDYEAEIAPIVARAHVFNGRPFSDAYPRLSSPEVNQALNQCAVGLALSREEGSMNASGQYLLAGLPVVSTPSEGGRDDFYHPDYVRIVAPHPRAVAEAVSELRDCKLTSHEIRARTLERMREHRERLFRCVDELYASQGCHRSFAAEWPSVFVNTLTARESLPIGEILAAVQSAHAG